MRRMQARIAVYLLLLLPAASTRPSDGGLPSVPAGESGGGDFTGLTLENALAVLETRGLKLVYTSFVVRPELRVVREPESREPREVLRELLAPHGLVAREGPGGVLTILPGDGPPPPPLSTLCGVVRERLSGRPLGDVSVRLTDVGRSARTADDGTFEIPAAAGPHLVEVIRSGYLVQHTEVVLSPDRVHRLRVELSPVPTAEESIDVTSTRIRGGGLSGLAVEHRNRSSLTRVGGDALRPLSLLPGTAGNDVSARPSVRGGRRDELMVLVDGFEVFEAYHLRDFDSALSILAPDTIGSAELLTGGFSAAYGDRMGGVLELTTVEPTWNRRVEFALSAVDGRANSSGAFGGGDGRGPGPRGHWLAAARGGLLQLAADLAQQDEDPRFADVYGKVDYQARPGHSLRGQVLAADDRLDFLHSADDDPPDAGVERFRTSYANDYLWLSHVALLGAERYAETRASWSGLDGDRRGSGAVNDRTAPSGGLGGDTVLSDRRDFEVAGLAQDWGIRISAGRQLKWGFDLRNLKADYDYFNTRQQADRLRGVFDVPGSTTALRRGFREQQYALYLSHRQEISTGFTAELGLRYDRNTVLDGGDLSPRLDLSYAVGPHTRLRGAWGLFYQTQRLYELQVEDGEDRFFPAERAEHRGLGFEHDWERPGRSLVLRAEVYERRIHRPRVRFENLFDPISLVPELEDDRVRISPERGQARGIELLLRGRFGPRIDGFVSYTWSRSEDRIDGRDVHRNIDQPHKLGVEVGYRSPWGWTFNVGWEYHTGWPTTAVALVPAAQGGPALTVGPLYGERLPAYSRLDLHVGRTWRFGSGELSFFVDVQNFTDARNVRGFEIPRELDDGETIAPVPKFWAPLLPNVGVRWAF